MEPFLNQIWRLMPSNHNILPWKIITLYIILKLNGTDLLYGFQEPHYAVTGCHSLLEITRNISMDDGPDSFSSFTYQFDQITNLPSAFRKHRNKLLLRAKPITFSRF